MATTTTDGSTSAAGSAPAPERALRWLDEATPRRLAIAVALPVWLVYLATATYTLTQVTDNRAVAVEAWSLAERGTLDLPSEWPDIPWRVDRPGGETYTNRFPGAILWAVPFYAVVPGRSDPGDVTHLSYGPAGVAAATAAAGAVGALTLLFRRLGPGRVAAAAAWIAAFGTATWSVSADSMWTHGPAQLWLALGMLGVAAGRWGRGGLAYGLAMFTRPQLGVVAAVTGLYEGWRRRALRPIAWVAVGAAVGLFGLVLYTWLLFGSLVPTAGYGTEEIGAIATRGVGDFARNILSTLIDLRRGVLVYSPFLVVLVPGLRRGWRSAPTWVRGSALAGLAALAVQLRANAFDGGASFFGYRLPIEALTLAAPLLLLAYREWVARRRPRRIGFWALVIVSVAMTATGATVLSYGPAATERLLERLEVPAGECPTGQVPPCL